MIERLADMLPGTVGFRATDALGDRTDIDWMARATRLFAWMIPGEARVFPLDEFEQANAWVAGVGG